MPAILGLQTGEPDCSVGSHIHYQMAIAILPV
jgi:hypothetical protein